MAPTMQRVHSKLLVIQHGGTSEKPDRTDRKMQTEKQTFKKRTSYPCYLLRLLIYSIR